MRVRAMRSARFEEVEHSLARDYDTVKGKSRLEWEKPSAQRAPGGIPSTRHIFKKKPRFGGAYFFTTTKHM